MSDSESDLVSVELPLETWMLLLDSIDGRGVVTQRIHMDIHTQLPPALPGLAGAVIIARRHGEASEQMYVRCFSGDDAHYKAWRRADLDDIWETSRTLRLVRVLSSGFVQ